MSYMVAPNIEPYRKGQSFATWIKRLAVHFRVNKVKDNEKTDQMFILGGDFLFSMAEILYPTEAMMEEVSYEILVQKLKERLDKTDSVLLRRYIFGTKVQQSGESASDFIFSLKLQAEHCEFGEQKNRLILDRILVGLSDGSLKHRLFTEDSSKLTLEQAENIIATWEMAATHSKALTNSDVDLVASLDTRYPLTQGRGAVIQRMREAQQNFHGSVKSRLGVRPEIRPAEDSQRVQFHSQRFEHRNSSASSARGQYKMDDQQWPIDQRICYHCGRRGHVRRKCYKWKNECGKTVNRVDTQEAITSANHLTEPLDSLRIQDSDSDGNISDHGWKRGDYYGSSKPNKNRYE
ncbi:uncharacterized protein LOC131432459 [Malaya genurostris]|uniref:uncharacterized protein LOC131432459 n=1 Tax=Malaya genurostris TaxID=325434 RepID=UPI0026F3951B|nr:uncharacterized protein LOC131432459 [Malaya genurostris]